MDELSRIKLYVDEDAMYKGLAAALRIRGVAVITALDAGLISISSSSICNGSAPGGSMGVSSLGTSSGSRWVNRCDAYSG
jgi:hypothetical protein